MERMDCPTTEIPVSLSVDIPPTSDVCCTTANSIQSLINSSGMAGSRQTLQSVIEAITQRRINKAENISLREALEMTNNNEQLSLVCPAEAEGKPQNTLIKRRPGHKGRKIAKKGKSLNNLTRNQNGNYPLPENESSLVYPDMFYPYPGVSPVLVLPDKFLIKSEAPPSPVANQTINTYSEQPSYVYTTSPNPVFNFEEQRRTSMTSTSSLSIDNFLSDFSEKILSPESDTSMDFTFKAGNRTIEALSNKIRKRQQSRTESESGEEIGKRICLRALSNDEGISMKSPDSGYNEACSSPTDSVTYDDYEKHRNPFSHVMPNSPIYKENSSFTHIAKLENDMSGYQFFLEAPISTSQKLDEDRMTYLNKGAFYDLSLELHQNLTNRPIPIHDVKSIVQVVFRQGIKGVLNEDEAWKFWHSRQHSSKTRVLDVDINNSKGFSIKSIEEIANNGIAVRWNPKAGKAMIHIAINCLSTDFSYQKGIKGLPLHILIDTFEDEKSDFPFHRAYCQVKTFCDKGAERKARDEERRRLARNKAPAGSRHKPKIEDSKICHPYCERSFFYSMRNLYFKPILFKPNLSTNLTNEYVKDMDIGLDSFHNLDVYNGATLLTEDSSRVLLYVRERQETVFTPLHLADSSVNSLKEAIEKKYSISSTKVHNIYRRSRKGIIAKMDDDLLKHYCNESTFLISLIRLTEEQNPDFCYYNVTLTEIDE
ncbi:DgyrCDS1084 [Dimorphilus gyrociliatus]|nr:DgyrCDS1084 [Dimorphilus gyrociliatus]